MMQEIKISGTATRPLLEDLERIRRPFRVERVPQPRPGTAGFPKSDEIRGRPLDLEIGCGVGLHPILYARANPERVLIAVEHTPTRFSAFQSRVLGNPGLENLHPVHADAVEWVSHRVPPGSLSRIFLLYPNPYPKPSDRKRRWYAMPFFGRLVEALQPGGEIHLSTNIPLYASEAREAFREIWGLRERRWETAQGSASSARTHFEKKYLERGETCFTLVGCKATQDGE